MNRDRQAMINNLSKAKRDKLYAERDAYIASLNSPEAKRRQEWRDLQRQALREMGMTTEEIEAELLPSG